MLFLIQWNAQSLVKHGDEFKNYLNSLDKTPEIICIQESWLYENFKFNIPGYKAIPKCRKDQVGGGVVTFIKLGLSHTEIEVPENVEGVAVRVGDYNILNFYFPERKFDFDQIRHLFVEKTIVCGDFNAHNFLWGGNHIDTKGKQIELLLNKTEFILLNNGAHTFHKVDYSSALDLTMVHYSLFLKSNWFVAAEDCGSNHQIVHTYIDINFDFSKRLERLNLKKADWYAFMASCHDLLHSGIESEDVDIFNDNIVNNLKKIAVQCIPKSRPFTKKTVPWWDENCSKAISLRKKAYRRANKSKLDKDVKDYKTAKHEAYLVLKHAKQSYWRSFCNNLKYIDAKIMWRVMRTMSGKSKYTGIGSLKYQDRLIVSDVDKANVFAEMFARNSSDSNLSEAFKLYKVAKEPILDNYIKNVFNLDDDNPVNAPFSLTELKKAISKTGNSTPGFDQIHYEYFRRMPDTSLSIVLQLYNTVWYQGCLPKDWKVSTIVPIVKPGKLPCDPASYRPIALTSTLCKIMEHMIVNRLMWYLEKNGKLNNYQCGFRKQRSTVDHLTRLVDSIKKAQKSKRKVVAVFLDMEKAYDLVWPKGLLYKFAKLGINGRLFNFITDFMSQRYLRVRVGADYSDIYSVDNGTPQGSVLSPFSFLAMINDLPSLDHVSTSLYADDIAFWVVDRDVNKAVKLAQEYLNKVQDWAFSWGFKISTVKTQAIVFTRSTRVVAEKLKLGQNDIDYSTSVKFLGIEFDRALTFNAQVKKLIQKTSTSINILRCLHGYTWGADRDLLLKIYRSLIRSKLEYAGLIYTDISKSNKKKLDSIQYKALKLVTGAIHGTPLQVLQAHVGEPPLYIRRVQQTIRYALKVNSIPDHPAQEVFHISCKMSPIGAIYREFRNICPVELVSVNQRSTPEWLAKNINIDVSFHDLVGKKDPNDQSILYKFQEYKDKWSCFTKIYTDGSKKENLVSCSFYVPEVDFKFQARLSNDLSVYTAELVAIYNALKFCYEYEVTFAVIFSDSMSSLLSIKSGKSDSRQDIIVKIIELYQVIINKKLNVWLAWVPGHCSIAGNEQADRLAKEALNYAQVTYVLKPSFREIFGKIKKYCLDLWQDSYTKSTKGLYYKNIYPEVSYKSSRVVGTIKSIDIQIFRASNGWCRLNGYLRKIRKHETGNCDHCDTFEDSHHVIMVCPLYEPSRQKLRDLCSKLEIPFTFKNLFVESQLREELGDFLKEIKVFL